jgi:hypothetical protein
MFFLQSKSTAAFYGGSNLTFALRQSSPQVIMKIDRGVYGIVEVNATFNGGLMVMCSWDDFFTKHLTNPDVQFNLDVHHEIMTKIPFPQWKRDLRELF